MHYDEIQKKLICDYCGSELSLRPEMRGIDPNADVLRDAINDNLVELYYDDGTNEKIADTNHIMPYRTNNLALKKVVVPGSIQSIPPNCFKGCWNLEEIEFRNGNLRFISNCFEDTSITSLTLPYSLEYISLFRNKRIKTVDMSGCNPNVKYLFMESSVERVFLPKGAKVVPEKAFWNCNDLQKLEIPDTVEIIEDYALLFPGSITINLENLTYVGEGALGGHKEIKTINTKSLENLTYIGDGGFSGCTGIKTIYSNKIEYIGREAFSGSGLEEAVFDKEGLFLKNGALGGCHLKRVDFLKPISGEIGCISGGKDLKEVGLSRIETANSKSRTTSLSSKMISIPYGVETVIIRYNGEFALHYNGDKCTINEIRYEFVSPEEAVAFFTDHPTFESAFNLPKKAKLNRSLERAFYEQKRKAGVANQKRGLFGMF